MNANAYNIIIVNIILLFLYHFPGFLKASVCKYTFNASLVILQKFTEAQYPS